MKLISHRSRNFERDLAGLVAGIQVVGPEVTDKVARIFAEVEAEGDAALLRWTEALDMIKLTPETIKVTDEEKAQALQDVPRPDLAVIKMAAGRILAFHKKQRSKGFCHRDGKGSVIQERLVPLDRVGLYIPGGRAPLASTVLMTAIPAKLAGVKQICMVTPCREGRVSPHVIAAAVGANVDVIYKVGGAQAVAALATGTGSIARVDKIVGPGNVWVTAAKNLAQSRGLCGIDSIAGPSEVVIAADDSARPALVAADLLSQAEHGPGSFAVLVTDAPGLIEEVEVQLEVRLARLNLSESEAQACKERIYAALVPDRATAVEVVNRLAPEHLEVMTNKPRSFIGQVRHAGSIFLGPYSPVPAGDYMAGGNHVLPTGGTARWSSPLGVYDFVKRQTVTCLSKEALRSIAQETARFAEFEGLPAHAASVLARFEKE